MPEKDIGIRIFRRYPLEGGFKLPINGRSATTRTTDYSMNSAGEFQPGNGACTFAPEGEGRSGGSPSSRR